MWLSPFTKGSLITMVRGTLYGVTAVTRKQIPEGTATTSADGEDADEEEKNKSYLVRVCVPPMQLIMLMWLIGTHGLTEVNHLLRMVAKLTIVEATLNLLVTVENVEVVYDAHSIHVPDCN